jgi:hypothetical protein
MTATEQATEQAPTATDDFLDAFDDETMFIEIVDEAFVGDFIDQVSDSVIEVLRDDPRWSTLRYSELDLLFADLRAELRRDLLDEIGGYVPFAEVRRAAKRAAAEAFNGQSYRAQMNDEPF